MFSKLKTLSPQVQDPCSDDSGCPNGPCGGPCVVPVTPFTELELNSPSYPSDSGRNVSCSWTLVAPLGYSVALNFLDMDMRADPGGSCVSDYVKLTDSIESPQSVLSPAGRSFCGELPPNYPGPSQLSSAGHRLTVDYRTDISNVARGRGFAAVATAVNPLCTAIRFCLFL